MQDFIKVMKAVSDPNQIKMIKLLQRKAMCVCEMKESLRLSQSTVSKHLKILEEAGLITYTKEGLWVNYHLIGGESSPHVASILGNLKHWLEDDPDVRALVERLLTLTVNISADNIFCFSILPYADS